MAAASIVFTVHNRRELLVQAVEYAKAQTVPVEILVLDDASTDGVGAALAQLHPDVRHVRSEVSRGPCYQRNLGVTLAKSDIVFVLDDDSMLVSPRTVEQTLSNFVQTDATLVAIPFRNILHSTAVQHARTENRSGTTDRELAAAFTACAYAVKSAPFLSVGGYEPTYFYMGEEGDLAIRLLDRGFFVDLGSADPIDHMQPVGRKSYRADYYGRRNDILFYYLRCPTIALPSRIAGTIIKGIIFGLRNRCMKATVHGLFDGLRMIATRAAQRRPVRQQTFTAFMRMKHGHSYDPDQLQRLLAQ